MNNQTSVPPFQDVYPFEPIAELAGRRQETEEALQQVTTSQADAVIDPSSTTPFPRQQTQTKLQEAEERYRQLLERVSALVFELEADGTICFVNDVVCKITGYPAEELLGKNWWSLLVPAVQSHQVVALYLQWHTGDVARHPLTLTARNRVPVLLEVTTANRYDAQGRLERIVALGRVQTSREQETNGMIQRLQEQANSARETLALLDMLVTTAPIGVAFLDCDLRFVRINRLLAGMNGLSISDHIGRTLQEVVPNLANVAEPIFRHVLATGEPIINLELSGETAAHPGVQHYWQESFYPVYAADGQILGIGVIARDITERKQAEAEHARLLAQAQQAQATAEAAAARMARLQAITAMLSQAITPQQVAAVMIEQGVAASGARAGSLSLLKEDQLEVLHADGYPPEMLEPWQRFPLSSPVPLAESVRTGTAIWLESQAARAERYPQLAATSPGHDQAWAAIPLFVEGQAVGTLGLSFAAPQSFDAEDRSFMTSLVEQCAQALQRAWLYASERQAREHAEAVLRSSDEVLAIVSHDLKNPLTVIKGRAAMLQRQVLSAETLDLERMSRSLQYIEAAAVQMITQINEVLDMARLQTGKPIDLRLQPLDLVALTRRLADAHQQTTTRHCIQVDALVPELVGHWDEARLERVVANLLSNALKYSPYGGVISLTISCEETTTGKQAVLVVSDEGIGIPAADLPHIFGKFHRAGNVSSCTQGSGLGLASVYQLVEQHHGTIGVTSEEGHGATFTVRLPLGLGMDNWEV